MTACGGGGLIDTSGPAVSVSAASGDTGVRRTALAVTSGAGAITSPAAASDTWNTCAAEGRYCAFSGTHDVRYGTDTKYFTATLSGGTDCSNAVFGDPAPAEVKSCAFLGTTPVAVPGDGSADADRIWVACGSEGQTCSTVGSKRIRYGAAGTYVYSTLTGPVACNNATFGDPAPGIVKACAYATDTAVVTSSAWVTCAQESQPCSFAGTRMVRYGTATQFFYGTFSGGVDCSNAVFGDPAVGVVKGCAYAADAPPADPAPSIPPASDPAPSPSPATDPVAPASPDATGANPPIVLNATHSAAAGDVVSLQGENFGSAPRVYLESAPTAPLAIVNQVATNWIAVQIPAGATGALTLRVATDTGTSAQVKLNAAIPLHLDATQLSPGGAFRLFGRNLRVSGAVPSLVVDGTAATIDLAKSDEHMLVATAPTTLAPTSASIITVDNGNGSGRAQLDRPIAVVASGSGDPFALGVGWGAGFAAIAGRTIDAANDARLPTKAVCNGSQDDAPAIQSAVDLAGSTGGGVVTIPPGQCRLAGGINLRSNVVLQGAGKTATTLAYESNYPISATGIDLAGLRNLTLTHNSGAEEAPLVKDSTRVFLQNVGINLRTSRQMFLTGNRNIAIVGSDIVQEASISGQGPFLLNDSAGLVFEGNTVRWVDGAPAFGHAHESYLHANHFTRDGSHQNQGGTVHSMVIDFAWRVAVVGNVFDVANGPITNTTRNDGETILAEGGGAGRTENLGYVTAASATTVSDSGNTINVDPFGTGGIPENYGIAIVGGKGAGQTRRLVAYAKPTMTVERPWNITPDATSRYATFVWGLEKSLIKGNTLSQNPRGIWLYHTAIRDVDVIGNSISEGGGIYMRSYQNLANRYFMPVYNVIIAGNTVSNTTGRWMSYINSVFVNSDARAFGIATLGVEIRGNRLVTNRPNVESSWEEYAGTEGYMNMMRVENYSGYESSSTPRLLGTIFNNNACLHCAVAVRVGTGAGGATILNTQLNDSAAPLADWATTSTPEKSVGTLMR